MLDNREKLHQIVLNMAITYNVCACEYVITCIYMIESNA
jgi:hypothetical protein